MFKVTMTFNKAYALMKIPSDPLTFIKKAKANVNKTKQNNGFLDLPDPDPIEKAQSFLSKQDYALLNDKLTAVNPRFLLAWADLREHIQQWEVGYFFELL